MSRPSVWLWPLLCWIVAGAIGCGSGSSGSDHASVSIQDPPVVDERAVSQPGDRSITAIGVTASAEYNAEDNTVQVFTLVKDQTETPLFIFNKYNFLVALNPNGNVTNIDKSSAAYQLAVSDGTAVEDVNAVCLVLDVSGSMQGEKLAAAKDAASSFVDGMNAGDRTAVVSFSDSAQIVQPLTGDTTLIKEKIAALAIQGATNIGAALQKAAGTIGTRPGRRAVILLTDGGDTNDPVRDSWAGNTGSSRWQAVLAAQENDLRVYTIGFGLDPIGDAAAIADLETIANETGGKTFLASTATDLTNVLQTQIPREIDALPPLHTYILSFGNPSAAPGKTVPFLLSLEFQNGNGLFNVRTSGTYVVP